MSDVATKRQSDEGKAQKTVPVFPFVASSLCRFAAHFVLGVFVLFAFFPPSLRAQVLDPNQILARQTFWDNKDFAWYAANIPLLETPDPDLDTTYNYRWELVTKHLVYASPETGYVYTEFMDRPFWSGRYGAISCAAGHHLYEVRWLHDPQYAQDYARYWFQTQGAQPRRYSCWLADAVWGLHLVQDDAAFAKALLKGMVQNYEGWERERFSPDAGLFWTPGHDDGMEYNINSRQSQDLLRGAPGYRPTLNAYLYADALAIAKVADLASDAATAQTYRAKAAALKENVQTKLWDKSRDFFFHLYKQDEQRDGYTVKAGSLTHQTGRYAGCGYGREEIGFVPWQFNLPDAGFESAWKYLMDRDRFFSDFGPTTVERHDPMFHLSPTCCWWSGQSWPYATAQTLAAMANALTNYDQKFVTKADYYKLLATYSKTHRKEGKPYLAEAANPDTGSFKGHDSYNHSEHYFHSSFNDLVITGLIGLKPRADDTIEINPLAPDTWDYFALDNLLYHGHRLSILWDRTGDRYHQGAGLHMLADGASLASSPNLEKLTARLPRATGVPPVPAGPPRINFAVNNEGSRFPRAIASFTSENSSLSQLNDGNYWYTIHPPNRWTTQGSPNESDSVGVDFGIPRPIDTVKLYFLDDGDASPIRTPAQVRLEYWAGEQGWLALAKVEHQGPIEGHRATTFTFPTIQAQKLRAVLTHQANAKSGLAEFEAWGSSPLPLTAPPAPKGNLAATIPGAEFPKVSASFTSRFDKVTELTDGVINFSPEPRNRWTAYESPNPSDWIQLDFGAEKTISRLDLYLYDDHGGVQPPKSYTVQIPGPNPDSWIDVPNQRPDPKRPAGGRLNTVTFAAPVRTSRIRVLLVHNGKSRSGLTELEAWAD
jgi:hypothetical protein